MQNVLIYVRLLLLQLLPICCIMWCASGGMADASGSKSDAFSRAWGFDSPLAHQGTSDSKSRGPLAHI